MQAPPEVEDERHSRTAQFTAEHPTGETILQIAHAFGME
jgi:hypothetical protein